MFLPMQVRDPPPNFEGSFVSPFIRETFVLRLSVMPYREHHRFHEAGFLFANPSFGPEVLRIRTIYVLILMQDPGIHPDLSLLSLGQLARPKTRWKSHTPGGK